MLTVDISTFYLSTVYFYTPPHLLMSTFFHSTTAVKSKRIKKLTWGKKGHLGGKAYLGEEHDNIIGIGKREETTVSDVVVANPVAVEDLSNVNVDLIGKNHNHRSNSLQHHQCNLHM